MTPRQASLLSYVVEFQSKFGYSPSYTEIADALALKSKSNIHYILNRLKNRGYIEWDRYTARSIKVICNEEPRMKQWSPIETAPQDGTIILAWCGYVAKALFMQQSLGHGRLRQPRWIDQGDKSTINPTHWMRLPEPPK